MNALPFVQLGTRSVHSVRRSLLTPESVPRRAQNAGHAAAALTDEGWMAGHPKFSRSAAQLGIPAIYGMHTGQALAAPLYVFCKPEGFTQSADIPFAKSLASISALWRKESDSEACDHLLMEIIAQSGSKAVCVLDLDDPEGQIQAGQAGKAGKTGKPGDREQIIARLVEARACQHIALDPSRGAENWRRNLAMAREFGMQPLLFIPWRAQQDRDWDHLTPEQVENHKREAYSKDALAILIGNDQNWTYEGAFEKLRSQVIHALRPEEALQKISPICEQVGIQPRELMARTTAFAMELAVHPSEYAKRPKPVSKPAHPVLKDPQDALRVLTEQAREGLQERMPEGIPQAYEDRIRQELRVIDRTGFAAVFLAAGEVVRICKRNRFPMGPGRGSAASSLVSWTLGITQVDPLREGLLFERFLDEERSSPPDFDIDIRAEDHPQISKELQDFWGPERTAKACTWGTYQKKEAFRISCRTMGEMHRSSEAVGRFVHNDRPMPTAKEIERILDREGEILHGRTMNHLKKASQAARRLQESKAVDSSAEHPGALVLHRNPCGEEFALHDGAIQEGAEEAEDRGGVKIDLLRLTTISLLQDTIQKALNFQEDPGLREALRSEIQTVKDHADPWSVPEQKDVLRDLHGGNTQGVFQLGKLGLTGKIRELKPESIAEVRDALGLYRPGPMAYFDSYTARARGREKPDLPEGLSEEAGTPLRETYGILIYQEQMMEILRHPSVGGLTPAEGYRFIKSVSKKNESVAQALIAQKIHDPGLRKFIAKGMGYAFNKAHSAVYARIAYATAFYKHHAPTAFLMAMIDQTLQKGSTGKGARERKLRTTAIECARRGMRLCNPSPEHSRAHTVCRVAEDGRIEIIPPLRAIHGIDKNLSAEIGSTRPEDRPANRNLEDWSRFLGLSGANTRLERAFDETAQAIAILPDPWPGDMEWIQQNARGGHLLEAGTGNEKGQPTQRGIRYCTAYISGIERVLDRGSEFEEETGDESGESTRGGFSRNTRSRSGWAAVLMDGERQAEVRIHQERKPWEKKDESVQEDSYNQVRAHEGDLAVCKIKGNRIIEVRPLQDMRKSAWEQTTVQIRAKAQNPSQNEQSQQNRTALQALRDHLHRHPEPARTVPLQIQVETGEALATLDAGTLRPPAQGPGSPEFQAFCRPIQAILESGGFENVQIRTSSRTESNETKGNF